MAYSTKREEENAVKTSSTLFPAELPPNDYKILIGNFNAKAGKRRHTEEQKKGIVTMRNVKGRVGFSF